MEDLVGAWWDRLIRRAAYRGHPQARVTLAQVERIAPTLFRALGGDAALTLGSAVGTAHGGPRRLLERIAGTGERVELAWRDARSFYLPDAIDAFPDAGLNRGLYLWLIALAAADDGAGDWFDRNRRASAACLAAMPGIAALYRRLLAAHLMQRATPQRHDAAARAQEDALRAALHHPATDVDWPGGALRVEPVPLWLHPAPPAGAAPRADDGATPTPDGGSSQDARARRRYRARRDTPDERKSGLLTVFRAESLFTWDEYLRVNRHQDQDDTVNPAAAEDMDRLTVSRGPTRAARLRLDLDLPAAAYDDTPLGPGILLPEWDWKRQRLEADHCHLKPMLPHGAQPSPLPERLRAAAHRLRRQFQALAPSRTRRHGETQGQDIDLDRVVRFLAERAAGAPVAEPACYIATPPRARSLACLLLADLSLSTEAWVGDAGRVIDVVRDALLLFAEALSASGDAFGLYGFSSLRRHEVRYLLLKDFAQRYDDAARGRILALRPGYYTRLGAAIRHSAAILAAQAAERRLLLIVSDGKPNDLDHYEGRYGVEDTRAAVLEARRAGLTPFCVTVDRDAHDYLPHLFGHHGYTVVNDARRLPQALTRLYAGLTR